jgi:hypothetical protein
MKSEHWSRSSILYMRFEEGKQEIMKKEKRRRGELCTVHIANVGSCHYQFASTLSNIELSTARSYHRSGDSHDAIVRSVCNRRCLYLKQSLGVDRSQDFV